MRITKSLVRFFCYERRLHELTHYLSLNGSIADPGADQTAQVLFKEMVKYMAIPEELMARIEKQPWYRPP